MTLEHRTWFPFILIGLSLGLLLAVILFVPEKVDPPETGIYTGEVVDPVDVAAYEQELADLVVDLQSGADALVVRNTMLAMRVPSQYRDLHFDVFLVIDAYLAQNTTTANARLAEIIEPYPWLN